MMDPSEGGGSDGSSQGGLGLGSDNDPNKYVHIKTKKIVIAFCSLVLIYISFFI
jgi:hypothetical protein